MHIRFDEFEFKPDPTIDSLTTELPAIERLKNQCIMFL